MYLFCKENASKQNLRLQTKPQKWKRLAIREAVAAVCLKPCSGKTAEVLEHTIFGCTFHPLQY